MSDILEYYVMRNDDGVTMWFAGHTWTRDLHSATSFPSAHRADQAAKQRLSDDQIFYVMGCVESDPSEED